MTLTDFLLARIAEDQASAKIWGRTGRELADCEAKRQIVAEHHPNDPCDAHDASFQTIDCDTLRFLALPYVDHPDYREEWKP